MNLRVDLILLSEQRSGSIVSPKGALRILAIVAPVVLLGVLATQFLILNGLNAELNNITLTWESAQPQQERAKNIVEYFRIHGHIRDELSGWKASRLSWSDQLRGLMRVVPENMQLHELTSNQSLRLAEKDKVPARAFALTLTGTAVGTDAETSVRDLETRMKTAEPFAPVMATVTVPRYTADTAPAAAPEDRAFQISCTYEEQRFK